MKPFAKISKLLMVVVSLALLSQSGFAQETAKTNVEIMKLSERQLEIHNSYVGHLIPFERVTVRAEAEGTAEKVTFKVGDTVNEGDLLVNISTLRLALQEKLSNANYELAEKDYQTEKLLFERQVSTASKLDSMRTNRDVQKIQLELAQFDLEKSHVKAPITGVVQARNVRVGEYISRGQAMLEIMDISRVLALVNIPEREMRFVAPGKEVHVRVDALPGLVFRGTVKTLGLEADLNNRSFPAEIAINNSDRQLLPGMMARVEMLTVSMGEQILIPRHAILERENSRVVFVESKGKAIEKTVKLGTMIKDQVQIVGGLKFGENVIVTGHHFLANNEAVNVVKTVKN